MAKKRRPRIKVIVEREERTKIAGVSYPEPYTRIPRQKLIKRYIRPGTRLIARSDRNNPHDLNAVALWLERGWFIFRRRYHMGYLPKERAPAIAAVLNQGGKVSVTVASITGGTRSKPTYGVNIILRY